MVYDGSEEVFSFLFLPFLNTRTIWGGVRWSAFSGWSPGALPERGPLPLRHLRRPQRESLGTLGVSSR